MLAGIGTVIYCITAERGMAYRMGSNPTTADLIAISIILLLLLEGTRRIYGMILPTVAIVFLLYCHFGQYFSGGLGHSGYSWKKTISYMLGYEAVFGSPMNASATMVFLFMVFGAFFDLLRRRTVLHRSCHVPGGLQARRPGKGCRYLQRTFRYCIRQLRCKRRLDRRVYHPTDEICRL